MGVSMNRNRNRVAVAFAGLAVICFCAVLGAQTLTAPKFKFDPDWPKPLPNKWKLGGVTGLAVDKDDNVWVLNRPNDLTDIELEAENRHRRLLCAAALDDPFRQARQRDRFLRCASRARYGRGQRGVRIYRTGYRPQI